MIEIMSSGSELEKVLLVGVGINLLAVTMNTISGIYREGRSYDFGITFWLLIFSFLFPSAIFAIVVVRHTCRK